MKVLFFLLINIRLTDPFVSQSPREFYVFYFPGEILVSTYTINQMGQISVSCTIPQWISFPIQSYLLLQFFCASLLHSLRIWLTISSLSLRSLHCPLYCVLTIFALIQLLLMTLFWVAIKGIHFISSASLFNFFSLSLN